MFMRMAVVEFGALPTAFMRVAIATVVLLPLLWFRKLGPQLHRRYIRVMLIGVLNSAIPFALFAYALLSITTGLSAILNAGVPLYGALVAWVWLKDRPTAARALGLAIGFLGIAMLAWDKASFKPDATGVAPAWAVLGCVLATLCYGIAANAAKRYLDGVPSLVTATGSQMGATVGLAVPAWLHWPAQVPGASAWLGITLLGVFCTALAYVLYFRLIEQIGPARALAVTFFIPVFAMVYGVLLLGEAVTGWMLFCTAVIVFGTALSTGLLKSRAGR